jgi:hypothetical protein
MLHINVCASEALDALFPFINEHRILDIYGIELPGTAFNTNKAQKRGMVSFFEGAVSFTDNEVRDYASS